MDPLISSAGADGVAHRDRTSLVRATPAIVLGMASDDVDELVAELARDSSLDLATREEVAKNQPHLLASVVGARCSGTMKKKRQNCEHKVFRIA